MQDMLGRKCTSKLFHGLINSTVEYESVWIYSLSDLGIVFIFHIVLNV